MKTEFPLFAIRSLDKPSASASNSRGHKQRGVDAKSPIPNGISDHVNAAHNAAVQDLLTVIAHVRRLFAGEFAEKAGLIARLNELESAAHEVKLGIYKHGFPIGPHYEEYEELSSLESELSGFSDLDFWDESPEEKLLATLITFWLDEIRCRGYDLFHLLLGSILYTEVIASFSALGQVKYPKNSDN
jgi:hypothetical protein